MHSVNTTTLIKYFQRYGIHIIDIHIGEHICFVIKYTEVDILYDLSHRFPEIDIIDILSSPMMLYHYLFIAKE